MSTPAVGDRAPEVALPDETGTIHRLSDQRGRWTLVYFYPEDDTSGCTTEACQFRDLHDDIVDDYDYYVFLELEYYDYVFLEFVLELVFVLGLAATILGVAAPNVLAGLDDFRTVAPDSKAVN